MKLWPKVLPLDEVSNNLGVLEARRGRYDEALANFERAYQSNPSDADFCFNRGVALWYEKRYPRGGGISPGSDPSQPR